MSIFAKPHDSHTEPDLKVLFLHGLEGSPKGDKSIHLSKEYGAKTPGLRTQKLRDLKGKVSSGRFQDAPKKQLKETFAPAYQDACDAVRFMKPDIIVGSSMGGAILAQMVLEGVWKGNCVFLAPAIENLLGNVSLPATSFLKNSVWVLGELDQIVSNGPNIRHCQSVGGSLIVSPGDSHRLHLALEKGLIDSAITTSIELSLHT